MLYSNTSGSWDDDTCITVVDTNLAVVKCSCTLPSSTSLYQYGLVNDYSRVKGEDLVFSYKEDDMTTSNLQVDSSYSFLMMTCFLLLAMCGVPVASFILDKRDKKI
jgi:hypothetical protein